MDTDTRGRERMREKVGGNKGEGREEKRGREMEEILKQTKKREKR